MGDKKVVDLSRFLLFEGAGDSEAEFGGAVLLDDDDDDGDDAESCVCDVGFCSSFQSRGAQIEISDDEDETHSDDEDDGVRDWEGNEKHEFAHHHQHHQMSSEFEEEDEEEEGMVSEVASTANSYSSRKCNVQSTTKKLSETEKNRLFWEACLAS